MDTAITDSPSERPTGDPGTPATAGTGSTAAGDRPVRPGRLDRFVERAGGVRPAWYAALLALLPALLMARRVSHATQMQYQDYWTALVRITNPDGSLHLRGLF
ncbi:MAG: hypothetical protein JO144_06470, partial [Actinobacteria bacterium]|nr:hypothetical protein [Actinomycetota bacterium]